MVNIDNETLRKIQLIQLEMLQEVDRICKKCDIHYNILAGTLLGAVRHVGYIPWDDDADVAFLREEYAKFRMPYEQGIFIDIFPLDGVPDNYLLRSFKNFECFCVRKLLWSKVGKITDKSSLKRKWFAVLDKIPEKKDFSILS